MTKVFAVVLQSFGDVILGSTLCRNIKLRFPDASITFCTDPRFRNVLENNPDIARIVDGQVNNFSDVLIKSKSDKYQVVYLPYMKTHEDTLWHHQPVAQFHLVDFYAKRCDNLELKDRRTFVYPDAADQAHVKKFFEAYPVIQQKPLVTLHVTSPVPSKSWGVQNFSKLAQALEHHGCAVMQIGAGNDERVLSPSIIDARGKFTARQTAYAIAHSLLYVGIDSGPAYLADAMGVPSIILYGPTTHIQAGPLSPLSFPLEPPRQQEFPCGPGVYTCSTHCQLNAPCILKLEQDEVTRAVLQTLYQLVQRLKAAQPVAA